MARPSIGWNTSPTNSTVASEDVLTEGIKDKVVVITETSSGLGEATARQLSKDAPARAS